MGGMGAYDGQGTPAFVVDNPALRRAPVGVGFIIAGWGQSVPVDPAIANVWNAHMNNLMAAMGSYQHLSPADQQLALGGINWMAQVFAQNVNNPLGDIHQQLAHAISASAFWTGKFTQQEVGALTRGLKLGIDAAADLQMARSTDASFITDRNNQFNQDFWALIQQQNDVVNPPAKKLVKAFSLAPAQDQAQSFGPQHDLGGEPNAPSNPGAAPKMKWWPWAAGGAVAVAGTVAYFMLRGRRAA